MTTSVIRFPVVSFRRIENPYEAKGTKMYVAVVDVGELPKDLDNWRDLNPRDPNVNSGVAKKIYNTLIDDPGSFLFRNRGITVIVDKATFDNEKSLVSLEMSDKDKNGLLDGGHTFRVIRNFISDNEGEIAEKAYVRLEIIEGINDRSMVVSIVESRNTSTQVKEQSLEELKGSYEDIKKVLSDKAYSNRIAYMEYELADEGIQKDIDIKDILSYLVCFESESFPRESHPIKAYSSKSSLVPYFATNGQRMQKYIPLLPQVLELRDLIYSDLPSAYNESGGKFGGLTGVTLIDNKPRMSHVELPFISSESSYRIPNGFVYPILAAFRNLVEIKDGKCSWKADPAKFFHDVKDELARTIGLRAQDLRNPNKLGKDEATWTMCYNVVELAVLRRKI